MPKSSGRYSSKAGDVSTVIEGAVGNDLSPIDNSQRVIVTTGRMRIAGLCSPMKARCESASDQILQTRELLVAENVFAWGAASRLNLVESRFSPARSSSQITPII